MPPTSVSLRKLEKLYEETATATENFQRLETTVLTENAQRLLILRLSAKLSQNEFERIVGQQSRNTSKYERGVIQKMMPETAEKYIRAIKPRINNPSFSQVKKEFTRMQKESTGYFKAHEGSLKVLHAQRKGALAVLKTRKTKQKTELQNRLKEKGLTAEINYIIDAKRGLVTDIFVHEPKVAIECKDVISKRRKEYKRQLQVLAYQGYKIKFHFPEIVTAALINSHFKLSRRDSEELQPFNAVFTDVGRLVKWLSSSRSQYTTEGKAFFRPMA